MATIRRHSLEETFSVGLFLLQIIISCTYYTLSSKKKCASVKETKLHIAKLARGTHQINLINAFQLFIGRVESSCLKDAFEIIVIVICKQCVHCEY